MDTSVALLADAKRPIFGSASLKGQVTWVLNHVQVRQFVDFLVDLSVVEKALPEALEQLLVLQIESLLFFNEGHGYRLSVLIGPLKDGVDHALLNLPLAHLHRVILGLEINNWVPKDRLRAGFSILGHGVSHSPLRRAHLDSGIELPGAMQLRNSDRHEFQIVFHLVLPNVAIRSVRVAPGPVFAW